MNENYTHPEMPEGSAEGIIKGMYLLKDAGKAEEGRAARATAGQRHHPARGHRRRRPAR
jgi:pyruvate dehydrogenase complex dehydrogenase (E1) component